MTALANTHCNYVSGAVSTDWPLFPRAKFVGGSRNNGIAFAECARYTLAPVQAFCDLAVSALLSGDADELNFFNTGAENISFRVQSFALKNFASRLR